MPSLFDKIRLFTLANLHDFLDAVIDLNSIGAIRQYVRDLESGRDILADQLALANAKASTLPTEIGGLQARHDALEEDIDTILGDGDPENDYLAEDLIKQQQLLQKQINSKRGLLETQQQERKNLDDAVRKLNSRIEEMKGRIEILKDLETTAKGKERAAKALKGISIGEQPSIDDVEQRLRDKATVAGAQLDRQLDGVVVGLGTSAADASAAAELIRRKQRLAEKKAAAEQGGNAQ
jgi:phage shock protein A